MPKCPLCETELEKLSETELYCPKDDLTMKLNKGRLVATTPDPKNKGKIQELEESIAELQNENINIKKVLFGKTEMDAFGL
jgi:DNA repair exonuclease SbcCD ATPase subunit